MGTHSGRESNIVETTACTAILAALENHDDCSFQVDNLTLYDFLDTEALTSLFNHKTDANVSITFDIHDVTVEVWKQGTEIRAEIIDEQP